MKERVRFSPAPSGLLHLGGARTALFNDLVAWRGGDFVLRFEDTDVSRSDSRFEAALLQDLAWLGLSWTEGPDIGGPFGPYRQSERTGLYEAALARLESGGQVYRCFCQESHLAVSRDLDAAEGRAPRYRGACSTMDADESLRRVAAGESYCWRFAVDPGREIVIDDAVHGTVVFHSADIGDFVVARSDGTALYDLACAVDDAAMAITLVIRGDDHLSNTARQIMLLEALGSDVPRYAHVPLVMGPDGRPLSKSRGAESVASLREAGYLPAAIVNHLALLGWSDPEGRAVLTIDELAGAFTLDRVSPSPPSHDPARLRWLNRRHASALTTAQRAELVEPFLPELPGISATEAALLVAGDLEVPGDAPALLAGVVSPLGPDDEARGALADAVAPAALRAALEALTASGPDAVAGAVKASGLPPRSAMPAVRAALTGRAHGLPVAVLMRLIGTEEAASRLGAALGG